MGLEPILPKREPDFESGASANSATSASEQGEILPTILLVLCKKSRVISIALKHFRRMIDVEVRQVGDVYSVVYR